MGLGLGLGPIRGHGTYTTSSDKLTTVFTFCSYLKRYLIFGVNAGKLGVRVASFVPCGPRARVQMFLPHGATPNSLVSPCEGSISQDFPLLSGTRLDDSS